MNQNTSRKQRFVREVTIQYNLCNEPWYAAFSWQSIVYYSNIVFYHRTKTKTTLVELFKYLKLCSVLDDNVSYSPFWIEAATVLFL